MFGALSEWDDLGWHDPGTQPMTGTGGSMIGTGSSGGINWESFIPKIIGSTSGLISSIKGNPYAGDASGRYQGGGMVQGGQGGVYAGGSFLGASGFGSISGTTLLLIGLGAVLLLRGGRR